MITITLIIVALTCIISFLAFNNRELFNNLAHFPYAEHQNNEKYRWLSAGFVHSDIAHLLINMYVLYEFGKMVEGYFCAINGEVAGRIIYALFYVFMIVLANLPTYAKYKHSSGFRSVGASGATSAIVFSFIIFEPTAMLGLFFIIPIPAVLFGILYLWYSSWSSGKGRDNIDHEAHFYGALAGLFFTIAMKPKLLIDFTHKIMTVF